MNIIGKTVAVAAVCVSVAPFASADAKSEVGQMPSAAQNTVNEAAAGGKVEKVKKLSDDGKLYRVEIKKDGKTQDLFVDSSGAIVGRHLH